MKPLPSFPSARAALAAPVIALLAACGSAAYEAPAETAQQREDRLASATPGGLFGFVRGLAATPDSAADQAEPRALDGITPPSSETDEPLPLE